MATLGPNGLKNRKISIIETATPLCFPRKQFMLVAKTPDVNVVPKKPM